MLPPGGPASGPSRARPCPTRPIRSYSSTRMQTRGTRRPSAFPASCRTRISSDSCCEGGESRRLAAVVLAAVVLAAAGPPAHDLERKLRRDGRRQNWLSGGRGLLAQPEWLGLYERVPVLDEPNVNLDGAASVPAED